MIEIVKMIEKKLNNKIKYKILKSNIDEKKNKKIKSKKIYNKLKIKNKLNTIKAINLTVDWYLNYFKNKKKDFSENQLKDYLNGKY